MTLILVAIIILLAWGIKLILFDLKKLEDENIELKKSNKEMLKANYKLTKKYNINQAKSHNPNNYGKF